MVMTCAHVIAHGDDQCLDAAGGLKGGFFNFSLHAMALDASRDGSNVPKHRGDAYKGFATTERVDYANSGCAAATVSTGADTRPRVRS